MTLSWKRVVLVALLGAIWPAAVFAQFGEGFAELAAMQGAGHAAISAVGTSVVERKPTHMRLYVQLLAKGKTLEAALEKLKERREAATTQLEALKVDPKSIVFGSERARNGQRTEEADRSHGDGATARPRQEAGKGVAGSAAGHRRRHAHRPMAAGRRNPPSRCC